MTEILKGIEVVKSMKKRASLLLDEISAKEIKPVLSIIRVGEKAEDIAYEKSAVKRCSDFGIEVKVSSFPDNISKEYFFDEFKKINESKNIHGILLFRPLHVKEWENELCMLIDPLKDVDCMSPVNIGALFSGKKDSHMPCTPKAVIEMLEHFKIDIAGKRVVIIGRSMVVGRPLMLMMLDKNATVTVCHTKTADLKAECRHADILIAAAGVAKMVKSDFVKKGATVIDVGINEDENSILCGDVDFHDVFDHVSMITPVPSGVGTVTTAVLAMQVLNSAKKMLAI